LVVGDEAGESKLKKAQEKNQKEGLVKLIENIF